MNFGILFAWIGVSLITIPLFQAFMRRRAVRAWEQQQADARSDTTTRSDGGVVVQSEGPVKDGGVNVKVE